MKPIPLSVLESTSKPKARLPGEPRPFKQPKHTPLPCPPIREPLCVGPDTIIQKDKEKKLQEILDKFNIPSNKQLTKQLLLWEKS